MEDKEKIIELQEVIKNLEERLYNKDITEKRKTKDLEAAKESVKVIEEKYQSKITELEEKMNSNLDEIVQKIVSEKMQEINSKIEAEKSIKNKMIDLNVDFEDPKTNLLIDTLGYAKIAEMDETKIKEIFSLKKVKIEEKENQEDKEEQEENFVPWK